MKNLKNAIASLIVFTSLNVHGQDKALMNAFSQSYDYEAIQKYDAAITTLNTVYNASSYEINIRLGWLNY